MKEEFKKLRERLRLLSVMTQIGKDPMRAGEYMMTLLDAVSYNLALYRINQRKDSNTDLLAEAQDNIRELTAMHEDRIRRKLDEAKAKRQADQEGSPHPPVGGGEG